MIPSVKTLRSVFGDNAKQARAILEMVRSQLEERPECSAIVARCFHPPKTYILRMTALDKLAGTYGVEAFQIRDGSWCEYLNAGDTYATTLLWFRGRYRVGCWGDIAERHGA